MYLGVVVFIDCALSYTEVGMGFLRYHMHMQLLFSEISCLARDIMNAHIKSTDVTFAAVTKVKMCQTTVMSSVLILVAV